MKNIAISPQGTTNTVSAQDLINAMVPNCEYSTEQILGLLPDRPRTSVRDTLHALVAKGFIWRHAMRPAVKFMLLEGAALRDAIDRKTTPAETPAWMRSNLTGYDAEHRRFRALCMTTRK